MRVVNLLMPNEQLTYPRENIAVPLTSEKKTMPKRNRQGCKRNALLSSEAHITHPNKRVSVQVKKRAVLDLLVGMRKQGLKHAKSFTPGEASDMLHVMAIPQPFAADQLAGTEPSWLLDNSVIEGHAPTPGAASAVSDILHRGERYFFKSLSELSRLRLEAGAPVARDLSRREAEVQKRVVWAGHTW